MCLRYKASLQNRTRGRGLFQLRHSRAVSLLFFLSLLLITQPAKVAAQNDEGDEVLRVRTDLITVPVLVTDARGRRIAGLTEKDFAVSDDGRRVETQYFASGAERVALCFALDASGSAREIIQQQRETAVALFTRFGAGSRVAVLRFTEKVDLTAKLTADPAEALNAFAFPALPGRRTAIFDAAVAAVRAFDARDPSERRIIILISDGLDTASAQTYAQAITEAQAKSVSIYVIHLPLFAPRDGRLQPRPASKGFRELAEKTGGKYFVLGDAKAALAPRAQFDLAPVFRAIEDDLKGQYVLGYYPGESARDGRPHRIEVGLATGSNNKLRVKTLRREYILKNTQ